MEGRNIFSKVPENTPPTNDSTTTPLVPVADTVTVSNHTKHHHHGFEISWLGTFDPAYTGIWIDSGLLLVFGGIPWQVRTVM